MKLGTKAASILLAAVLATGVMGGMNAGAAADLFVIQDFESYKVGTDLVEGGIGSIGGVVMPEVKVSEAYKAPSDANDKGSGDKNNLKIVSGESKAGDDTWQQIYINVPEDKQDWTAYKDGILINYFGNADPGATIVYQMYLVDKDGEIWGQKQNFTNGWRYPRTKTVDGKPQYYITDEGSAWGGMGFGDWMHTYAGIKISTDVFVRVSDNANGNGNIQLDFDQIKQILVRIDAGQMGAYKGQQIYLDNFFLAKDFTCDPESGTLKADGVDIVEFFKARSADAPEPTTPAPTQPAPTEPAATETAAPTEAPTTEKPADSTTTAAGSTTKATQSQDQDEDKSAFPVGAVVGIVIAVVVIGGGIAAYVIIKKKKGGASD